MVCLWIFGKTQNTFLHATVEIDCSTPHKTPQKWEKTRSLKAAAQLTSAHILSLALKKLNHCVWLYILYKPYWNNSYFTYTPSSRYMNTRCQHSTSKTRRLSLREEVRIRAGTVDYNTSQSNKKSFRTERRQTLRYIVSQYPVVFAVYSASSVLIMDLGIPLAAAASTISWRWQCLSRSPNRYTHSSMVLPT